MKTYTFSRDNVYNHFQCGEYRIYFCEGGLFEMFGSAPLIIHVSTSPFKGSKRIYVQKSTMRCNRYVVSKTPIKSELIWFYRVILVAYNPVIKALGINGRVYVKTE